MSKTTRVRQNQSSKRKTPSDEHDSTLEQPSKRPRLEVECDTKLVPLSVTDRQTARSNEPKWEDNKTGRFKDPNAAWAQEELKPGDLIWAPWHATAWRDESNKQKKNSKQFLHGKHAVVCSKRRMFCVYYAHAGDALQAFPMFTHGHRGISGVEPPHLRKFRIPVKDKGNNAWTKPAGACHNAVEAEALVGKEKSCRMEHRNILDYTNPTPIELSEYIELVGRLTTEGIRYVLEMHRTFRGDALQPSQGDQDQELLHL